MENIYIIEKKTFDKNVKIWWKKEDRGYTDDVNMAKEFTKEEADEITARPNSDKMAHKKSDFV